MGRKVLRPYENGNGHRMNSVPLMYDRKRSGSSLEATDKAPKKEKAAESLPQST